jgi:integrase
MSAPFKYRSTRYFLDGHRVPPGTLGAEKRSVASKAWWGRYLDADGKRCTVQLCADKKKANEMLAHFVEQARLVRNGMASTFADHRDRPLAEHLAEWKATLLAAGHCAKHVAGVTGQAARVLNGCGFKRIGDIDAARVQLWLADLRKARRHVPPLPHGKKLYTRAEAAEALGIVPDSVSESVKRYGLPTVQTDKGRRYPRETIEALRDRLIGNGFSIQTQNFYLGAVKQFSRWLVKNRRTSDNPLIHLQGSNVQLDRRHDRRALSDAELQGLLAATASSTVEWRGLSGRDRSMLYFTAMGTGLRVAELASLIPASFALDETPPVIHVRPGYVKNRREVTQPLPPDLADALREYLADKPAGEPVWPGTWQADAAKALRIDLKAAGIEYVVEGPSGPLYADFHALRHSFIAMLDRAGVSLKQAMQLARHSDPRLTMARYGRARLSDLGAAVETISGLAPKNFGRTSAVHAATVSGRNGSQAGKGTREVEGAKPSEKRGKKRNVS